MSYAALVIRTSPTLTGLCIGQPNADLPQNTTVPPGALTGLLDIHFFTHRAAMGTVLLPKHTGLTGTPADIPDTHRCIKEANASMALARVVQLELEELQNQRTCQAGGTNSGGTTSSLLRTEGTT